MSVQEESIKMDNTNEQLIVGGNDYGQSEMVNLEETISPISTKSKKDETLRENVGYSALVAGELPDINVTGSLQDR